MKYAEINKRYTAIVTEYLAKGYMVNTATMKGSQGERAHIDLTNGTEVIRIVLQSFFKWEDVPVEGWEIIVGRAAEEDKVVPHDHYDYATILNGNLEVLSCERFYKIGSQAGWFGTKEEAVEATRKHFERLNNPAHLRVERIEISNPKARELAKQYLIDRRVAKRVDMTRLELVKSVYKQSMVSYIVMYKGESYTLH